MALKSEIEKRYADKYYGVPRRPGLSYMVSPIMRTIGPPDMEVHTMTMPHFMFYAPNVTNVLIAHDCWLLRHTSRGGWREEVHQFLELVHVEAADVVVAVDVARGSGPVEMGGLAAFRQDDGVKA